MTSSLYVIVGECARDKHSQAMRDGFRACIPEMSTDRTEAIFGRIRTASDCIFFKLADQDWIGLRKFVVLCDYSEIIKNFSCDPISQVC